MEILQSEISPIETALSKENITNQVIEKLKADYLGLKINGIDDKEGFKKVEEARKHCKAIRVLAVKICKAGREDAIQIQKDWIAKEKEVVGAIDVTESHLESESSRIKEEEKRILFEAAQKAKLPFRIEKLNTIGVSVSDEELLKINDEKFTSLFNDLHSKVLAEKEAKLIEENKKRLEQERVAREKVEAEEREKIRLENEKLKAENEAKEQALRAERAKAQLESERQAKILAEQKRIADEEAAKQNAIAKSMLKKEREEREKIEAELKAKKELEEQALREAEEKEQAELSKGDKAKMDDLVSDLDLLKSKYVFKSKKHQALCAQVGELLDKTITHIITKK